MDLVGSAGSVEALIEKQKTKGLPKKQGPRVSWDERYRQLQAFKAEQGHCRVPQGWASNKALNILVNEQRRMYRLKQEKRLNTLDDEKQKSLEDIGFEFRINTAGGNGTTTAAAAAAAAYSRQKAPGDEQDGSDYYDTYEDTEAAFM